MADTMILPGEVIPDSALPETGGKGRPIKLGPGIRQVYPSALVATTAGPLIVDYKKNAIWVENGRGRYIPQVNDVVLAIVHHSSAETYLCSITPYTPHATLPQLAFEAATKKTRPQLSHGSLIYARISGASKYSDPELVCMNPSSGKSDGLGELKGGMVFDISLGMARRLLMSKQRDGAGIIVLEELAKRFKFEIAVGRNGRVWINAEDGVLATITVGEAIQQTDRQALDFEGQSSLVKKLLKG